MSPRTLTPEVESQRRAPRTPPPALRSSWGGVFEKAGDGLPENASEAPTPEMESLRTPPLLIVESSRAAQSQRWSSQGYPPGFYLQRWERSWSSRSLYFNDLIFILKITFHCVILILKINRTDRTGTNKYAVPNLLTWGEN